MVETETLRRHYAESTDEQLKKLVAEGLSDLAQEALPVLGAELRKRGFLDLAHAVDLQVRGLEPHEREALLNWVRSSPCPVCGLRDKALNACKVDSLYDSKIVLGCPPCLEAALSRAESRNTAGCLLAPLGLFFGARGAVRNIRSVKGASSEKPSEALVEYVQRHQATLLVSMRAGRELREP